MEILVDLRTPPLGFHRGPTGGPWTPPLYAYKYKLLYMYILVCLFSNLIVYHILLYKLYKHPQWPKNVKLRTLFFCVLKQTKENTIFPGKFSL